MSRPLKRVLSGTDMDLSLTVAIGMGATVPTTYRRTTMTQFLPVLMAIALSEARLPGGHTSGDRVEPRKRANAASQPQSRPSEAVLAPNGDFKGVWYGCGTANTLPGHTYVYSGGKATYSAWHRPMAVYARQVDKTFFVFGTPDNSPAISSYDHKTGAFAEPVVLGRNIDGNAHRNPTLLIDEQGFIYVFRGYSGMPTSAIRSAGPYDIRQWTPRTNVESDNASSYPQPWQLRSGEIFVSYRRRPGWSYRISSDGASHWQPTVNLIRNDDGQIYAITVAETGAYPRKLHIAWSRLGGGTAAEIHTKHLWARRYNVYYARSDDGGRTWCRSDGSPYNLPITEATAEKLYDCGPHGVWLEDIQLDSKGRPYVLFIDADVATYHSRWKLAKQAQGRWVIADITTSDHMYDGGALLMLADNDLRIYAPTTPTQPAYDGGEIEEWASADEGLTWKNTRRLTDGSEYSHNHVKTVLHHEQGNGAFRVFWSYGDATYPPTCRDVFLYYFGDGMNQGKRITRGKR